MDSGNPIEDKLGFVELSESEERRLLELRLFHHYMTATGHTLLTAHTPIGLEIWTKEMYVWRQCASN